MRILHKSVRDGPIGSGRSGLRYNLSGTRPFDVRNALVAYDETYLRDQAANRLRQLLQEILETRRRLVGIREELETFRREHRPQAPSLSCNLTELADYTLKQEAFKKEEYKLSELVRAAENDLRYIEKVASKVLPEGVTLVFDYGTHGGIAGLLGRYGISKVASGGAVQIQISRTGDPEA